MKDVETKAVENPYTANIQQFEEDSEIRTVENLDTAEDQQIEENSKHLSKKGETLESALRKFKRQSSGIISEVRKREAYDKPSVKRKKKSKEARRRKKMGRYNSGRW